MKNNPTKYSFLKKRYNPRRIAIQYVIELHPTYDKSVQGRPNFTKSIVFNIDVPSSFTREHRFIFGIELIGKGIAPPHMTTVVMMMSFGCPSSSPIFPKSLSRMSAATVWEMNDPTMSMRKQLTAEMR